MVFFLLVLATPIITPPPNAWLPDWPADWFVEAGWFVEEEAENPNGSHYAGIQSASYANSSYCQQPGCAVLIPNETLSLTGSYAVNGNGTASIGGETVAVTNGNVTYYIDESPLNSHPTVMVVEQ